VVRRIARWLVPWGFVAIAVGVCLYFAIDWVRVDAREHAQQLRAACRDADALRRARLLDEASAAYLAIARADKTRRCAGGRWAARRTQPAEEWRRELLAELRISGALIERGRIYRRSYMIKRGAGVESGREEARRRATHAYLVGLLIDPGATGARRGFLSLVRGLGVPAGGRAADARCDLAGRMANAGLMPEARTAYAQALRAGRTTACIRSGLERLRVSHGRALARLRAARHLLAADRPRAARSGFIDAFTLDSSKTSARLALAKAPGPLASDAGTWSRSRRLAADAMGTAKDDAAWIKDHLEGLALAAVLAGPVLVLLMGVLLWLARIPFLRRWMDGARCFHRFTRTRVNVAPFDGDADAPTRTVTDVFVHALQAPPLAPKTPPRAETSDLDVLNGDVRAGSTTSPVEDWLASTPSLAGFAAVVKWLISTAPRDEIRVNGRLMDASEQGVGLRLQVLTRRGRPLRSRLFWHEEILSGSADETYAYMDLARYAAPWVHDRKAK
jgi:hypothetical protein